MNSQQTTARPVDLDATDQFPVLDAVAYEAEVLSRGPTGPSGSSAATESDPATAGFPAPDRHAPDAAPAVAGSDVMSAVEHWIAQKTEELQALHDDLSLSLRERNAALARAEVLTRELAETSAKLEALNGRERALAAALSSEQAAAQRRVAELDEARGEAVRLKQELTEVRATQTEQSAALATSGAQLEQRSGELQTLQCAYEALFADKQRAARELTELETRLHDSETRARDAQRTIEAQTDVHAELTQRTQLEAGNRERLAAEVITLQAQLANCVESLQSRESYRAIYESTLQQLDAELAVERAEGEQRRSALESRLAELTAEHADTRGKFLAMEAALTAERQRAATEAIASAAAAQRGRELESAIASHEAEMSNARLEIERNRALVGDLTAALLKSQTLISDQGHVLQEREVAASIMASNHAEQIKLVAVLRGQIEELTARLATPAAERQALEERIAALTKEVAESDSHISRLESKNSDLRATVGQLDTLLAERDAELQRTTQIASINAQALGRVQSSIDELGRTLTASEGASAQAQVSILTRIDSGQNHSVVLRGRTTIGRDHDNDLSLAMRSVSRHHAVLIPAFRTAFVQDLSSTNGVLVNRRRVRCARLEHGDVITVGEAQFRYTVAPLPTGVMSTGSTGPGSTRLSLKHAS